MARTSLIRTVSLLVFTCLLWVSLMFDPIGLGDEKGTWAGSFQSDSEALVLGGISEDLRDGDHALHPLCRPNAWTHSTYASYLQQFPNVSCDQSTYTGNMGVQRLVLTPIAYALQAFGADGLYLVAGLKAFVSLLASLVALLLVRSVWHLYGGAVGVLTGLLLLGSNQLVLMGPNLYWMAVFWIAPTAYLLWRKTQGDAHNRILLWIGAAALLAIKGLSGLEGIFPVAGALVLFGMALWGKKAAILAAGSVVLGILAAVLIHLFWMALFVSTPRQALVDFLARVLKRTVGHAHETHPVVIESWNASPLVETLKHLLSYQDVFFLSAMWWILPAALGFAVLFKAPHSARTLLWVLLCWINALSWPLLSSPHTYIHGSLLAINTTLFGIIPTYIALGYLVLQHRKPSCLRAPHHP